MVLYYVQYIPLEYISHLLPISPFLANSTQLVLTRQSGQAKLLTLPSYSVWQFRRRSHFPNEPLTHDFARFWIPCGKEPLRTPYMYVHGNRDLAKARDRTWKDLMNPAIGYTYVVGLLATTLIIYNAQYIKYFVLCMYYQVYKYLNSESSYIRDYRASPFYPKVSLQSDFFLKSLPSKLFVIYYDRLLF